MAERLAEELDRLRRFPEGSERISPSSKPTCVRYFGWALSTPASLMTRTLCPEARIAYISFESFRHIAEVDGVATLGELHDESFCRHL